MLLRVKGGIRAPPLFVASSQFIADEDDVGLHPAVHPKALLGHEGNHLPLGGVSAAVRDLDGQDPHAHARKGERAQNRKLGALHVQAEVVDNRIA